MNNPAHFFAFFYRWTGYLAGKLQPEETSMLLL